MGAMKNRREEDHPGSGGNLHKGLQGQVEEGWRRLGWYEDLEKERRKFRVFHSPKSTEKGFFLLVTLGK